MRAVDQIVKDLEAVAAELLALNNKRERYLEELEEVYNEANNAMSKHYVNKI